jgi:hypothetical protein
VVLLMLLVGGLLFAMINVDLEKGDRVQPFMAD